jgi:hypothetical protein
MEYISILYHPETLSMPWLRLLDAGLSSRKSAFDPRPVDTGFVVDNVGMGYIFLRVCRFPPIRLILPLLYPFIHTLTTQYSR